MEITTTAAACSKGAKAAPHVRDNRAVFAAAEKRLLVYMASRMPKWVNSDHLSGLGLTAMLGAGLSFWLAGSHPAIGLPLVVVCLALNWFGDSLDGTLARVRDQQRPRYGFYLDHVIDIAGTGFLLGGLALSGYISPLIALGLLVGYLMVSAESYLATHALGRFRMSFAGVGPTEMRIILAVGALYLLHKPWVYLNGAGPFRLFDVGGVIAMAGMVFAFVVASVRNARALYLAETV